MITSNETYSHYHTDYQPSGYSARANHAHVAENMEELTFYERDVIKKICIVDDYKEGWWYGEAGGLGGYFPASCIETKSITEPQPEDSKYDVRDEYGQTPLHKAALGGECEATFALLQSGANVNAQDRHGWTPLHCAAK